MTAHANRRRKLIRKMKYGMNVSSFQRNRKKALIKRDGEICKGCGATGINLTIDHIVPASKEGTSDLINLQLLCSPC